MIVLELCEVTKEYSLRTRRFFKAKRTFQAVKQVNMTLNKGECLGLVGESGSGKTTLAKLIMKIEDLTSGRVLLYRQDINGNQLNDLDIYKQIQLVMQDSVSSLHPKMCVREIIGEPIQNYFSKQKIDLDKKCLELLKLVGLDGTYLSRYPHQLSGGQKQRVCIAKALAVEPDIIVFDESIASLDRISQTSIINMLKHIQNKEQISYLFITHDLQSTKEFCDRVAVMYQGEIVETLTDWDYHHLQHAYTRSLFQTG
jgi:ABC-type oligopeptide transport system ATPase subunit